MKNITPLLICLSFLFIQCKEADTDKIPTVYTVGDSTVKNGQGDGAGGLWGWGDFIGQFFDTAQVNVENHALGGTSSRTYIDKGLWQPVLDSLKKGDYVFIQFGHNDNGPINDDFRARGTIKGIGEESEEIDNMLTGKHEVVHTYGWYIRKIVRETQEKGAIPVVMSPIPRDRWKDGKVPRNNNSYGLWAKQVAEQEGATFIDLNDKMALQMEALGEDKIYGNLFYKRDHTHTSAKGAVLAASIISEELKKTDNPMKEYLLENPEIVLPKKVNIYLIGDSTVANNGNPEAVGWGVELYKYFDTTRVNIINRARGGRSSRSFYFEKLWKSVYDTLQEGDYVLMQFGHNDGGHIDQPKYRGSLKGLGDSTVVVSRKGDIQEEVHTYGWYMTRYIEQTKEKGAVPVVFSHIPRNEWPNGKVERADKSYGLWAKQVAQNNDAAFIDLNDSIAVKYEEMGVEKVKKFFPRDHTHTDKEGASLNALILAKSLKEEKRLPLRDYVIGDKKIKQLLSAYE
ncbi:rhamnogalacturonan acetylesterase [Galbibacter sp. EGI 63066]|uniref:rhamnogalacturonan acetylesterase n=1 Tax=Galbibacter sp. EGI 63066 TaxID=2993559 RepID=UPI002248BDBD|nr:rhamnogalacturonan acetylesterase [Galbibacter sp. EGI 63066]MCX2678597.1 rhamnogalacturonan acetylesterase [Galbibacter sp. EGI 63066]